MSVVKAVRGGDADYFNEFGVAGGTMRHSGSLRIRRGISGSNDRSDSDRPHLGSTLCINE